MSEEKQTGIGKQMIRIKIQKVHKNTHTNVQLSSIFKPVIWVQRIRNFDKSDQNATWISKASDQKLNLKCIYKWSTDV